MNKFPESIPDYNKAFQPAVKSAMSFVGCMDHAIEKIQNPEDVRHQLYCIGWSEAVKNTINNALSHYLQCGKRRIVLNRRFTENEMTKLVDMGNLVFSPNLTDQEAVQLLGLVRKAEGFSVNQPGCGAQNNA